MHDHFGRCYVNTIGLFSAFTFLRLYLLIHSIRLFFVRSSRKVFCPLKGKYNDHMIFHFQALWRAFCLPVLTTKQETHNKYQLK